MELKYMWGERFRLSTILYVWCRYALVANIVYLFTISGKIDIRVRSTPFPFNDQLDMNYSPQYVSYRLHSSRSRVLKVVSPSCDAGYKISSALSVLGRTAVIGETYYMLDLSCFILTRYLVVWGARTYAVFGKNRIVLGFFATVGLSCIILDIVNWLVMTRFPTID